MVVTLAYLTVLTCTYVVVYVSGWLLLIEARHGNWRTARAIATAQPARVHPRRRLMIKIESLSGACRRWAMTVGAQYPVDRAATTRVPRRGMLRVAAAMPARTAREAAAAIMISRRCPGGGAGGRGWPPGCGGAVIMCSLAGLLRGERISAGRSVATAARCGAQAGTRGPRPGRRGAVMAARPCRASADPLGPPIPANTCGQCQIRIDRRLTARPQG